MRLMMRPETKKRIPNGTITAAAAIAIPKKCTQPWEKRKRKKERERFTENILRNGILLLLLCISITVISSDLPIMEFKIYWILRVDGKE